MLGPRFAGVCQAHIGSSASVQARCETQMSVPPSPPGRLELMYRLRPSLEIAGCCSLAAVLMTGPRLTGVPHGPYCGGSSAASAINLLEALGPRVPLSLLQACASATHPTSMMILAFGFIVHLRGLMRRRF